MPLSPRSIVRAVVVLGATLFGLALMLPMFAVAVPLWMASALTRAMARRLEPQFSTFPELTEFDEQIGWRLRPNLQTHHFALDYYWLSTDGDGWPGRARLEDSDLVAIGDSFVAGYGVDAQHLFANLHRTPRIKPIGAMGYSMVQELLVMQRLGQGLRGKQVFWFVYYGNDLYENLVPDLGRYRRPFVRESRHEDGWEIVSSHVRDESWPITSEERLQGRHYFPRFAELCADTYLAKRAYSACEYLIGEGQRTCLDAGAELIVFGIPDAPQLSEAGTKHLYRLSGHAKSFDPDRPDNQVAAACERWGVPFVAGKTVLDLSCYKENDCHWNEEGHRRVGDMLVRLYRQGRRAAELGVRRLDVGDFEPVA